MGIGGGGGGGAGKWCVSYFRSNPLCAKFAYVFLNNYSIDFDQTSVKSRSVYFLWKNWKSSGVYGAQILETGVFVNHTFNVLGEFNKFRTLTSISTYYLTISAYIFLGDIYRMYMI